MCRHAIVAHMMDIYTGERYIYATVMLYMLMVCCNIPILVVWYDINCKFAAYFLRWAETHQTLLAVFSRLPTKLRFPLPCFHTYSHRCGWELELVAERCPAACVACHVAALCAPPVAVLCA